MSPTKKQGKSRGRPAQALIIEGDWQDAVRGALAKGKPPAPAKRSKKTAKKTTAAKKKRRSS